MRKISPNIKINIEQSGEDFRLKYKFNREENTITEEVSALNTGFGITRYYNSTHKIDGMDKI